ncbi:MAG TPA: Hsp20/alpha crystallin family protein [Solirubrobacteraceae bacterium]|jgi:HSP20 family protein
MTLVKWEPTRELGTLQKEMDRLFGSVFSVATAAAAQRRWIPAIDLVEGAEEYVLRADLPGLRSDDVKVELDENVLTISGERGSASEESSNGFRRIERASGLFARSLTLPTGIDGTAITARFSDGVLEVRIPRPAQRRPLRVAIETAAESVPAAVEDAQAEATETPAAA